MVRSCDGGLPATDDERALAAVALLWARFHWIPRRLNPPPRACSLHALGAFEANAHPGRMVRRSALCRASAVCGIRGMDFGIKKYTVATLFSGCGVVHRAL